jgi:4-aminobutyrate aminotransferase
MEPMPLPGPDARALIKRDSSVISPSYPRGYPLVVDHARGSEVWDVDGNRFLDFMSGIAVTATGHAHPNVVKAIQEQAAHFIHISSDFYHPRMIELAEKLNEISPFDEAGVSFLTNSGTEAIETAIKLARYHTGRSNFIGFTGAFHGRTMGAVSFTASKPAYHGGFYPLMSGVVHAPYPDPYHPVLERRSGEDYGEAVVRYIEDQILGHIVPRRDTVRHGAHRQVVGHRALRRGARRRGHRQGHRLRGAARRLRGAPIRHGLGERLARQHIRRQPHRLRRCAGHH